MPLSFSRANNLFKDDKPNKPLTPSAPAKWKPKPRNISTCLKNYKHAAETAREVEAMLLGG